jgi:hypothetical protein
MKILGVIWAILAIPAGFFAILAQICDSPNGCGHNYSALEQLLNVLFTISPALFILGAFSAFDLFNIISRRKYIKYFLVFLPLVPLVTFGLFVAYYLLINPA